MKILALALTLALMLSTGYAQAAPDISWDFKSQENVDNMINAFCSKYKYSQNKNGNESRAAFAKRAAVQNWKELYLEYKKKIRVQINRIAAKSDATMFNEVTAN